MGADKRTLDQVDVGLESGFLCSKKRKWWTITTTTEICQAKLLSMTAEHALYVDCDEHRVEPQHHILGQTC